MGFENFKTKENKKVGEDGKELENGSANLASEKDYTIAEKLAMTEKNRKAAGVSGNGSWGDLYNDMKEKGERLPPIEEMEKVAEDLERRIIGDVEQRLGK